MYKHSKHSHNLGSASKIHILLVVVGVALIGTFLLVGSHAASPFASVNASQGTLAGNTCLQTDTSGNKYVTFNGGSAVTPTVVGHQIQAGNTGKQIKMRGVAVWGVGDQVTNNSSFAANEYSNRQTVISTVKAWGSNVIRLRVLADDTALSQAAEIQQVQAWQAAAQAAGMYTDVTWWDSLDGSYSGANWATNYSQVFPMMTAMINALGPSNPWVFYEPFNEPNNVSESAWLAAMVSTEKEFRNNCYSGLLLLDTDNWSHAYNDADMTTLEQDDAGLKGMNGKNQIIFAKHDYANESYPNPDSGFDSSHWANNGGAWNFSNHLVWETEFGNYNGSASTVHPAWSAGAATWMAQKVNDGTLVGATGFLFGPWLDVNAMTASDNVTPTQWGGYVKDNFLANVN